MDVDQSTTSQTTLSLAGAALAVARQSGHPGEQLLVLQKGEGGHDWQLEALQERSALDKLQQLLQVGQWDAGLLLADSHGLDVDIVRK